MIRVALVVGLFVGLVVAAEAQVTRGITGSITVQSDGQRIQPRSDLNLDSPILVRIAAEREVAEGIFEYDIEFIGGREGLFDLRDAFEGADGSELSGGALSAIPIEIISNLEADATTDVFISSNSGFELAGGYRVALIVLGVCWVLVPIIVIARRVKPVIEEATLEVAPPTLAEQLRPLVEAASNRSLTTAERGRLELLLYGYWSEALGFGETNRAAAIIALRQDEQAGALLRAVELWLHGRDAPVVTPGAITSLLEPYREAPAIEQDTLA